MFRSLVAVAVALALTLGTASVSHAIGDEEREEEKVPLPSWTVQVDGSTCNLYGSPPVLWRSSIFIPARRVSACAGFTYRTFPSWMPAYGGAMTIARDLNPWHPLGLFQHLSLTAYPEDPARTTATHSFDGTTVTLDYGGLHPFEYEGTNYIWSRAYADALATEIRADFDAHTLILNTHGSPIVRSKPSRWDWENFNPRKVDGQTYTFSAAALRSMVDYYDMTRGNGPTNIRAKLDDAGTPYIDDWQNARLRVLVPGTDTVAEDLYANGSGERYVVLWFRNPSQAKKWLDLLAEEKAQWGDDVQGVNISVGATGALITIYKGVKDLTSVAPYLALISAAASATGLMVSRDYRLSIQDAQQCINSATSQEFGVILRTYQGHSVVGCIPGGYTDSPVNSAGHS